MKKSDRLRLIMEEQGWSIEDVAQILRREVWTVRAWLSNTQRPIPDDTLTLLAMIADNRKSR